MIFLPNKFEIYVSILRNTIQLLILKNGYQAKYLKNLAKIHKAEALFCDEKMPLDITEYSNELLKAVYLKKQECNKYFRFLAFKTENILINKKLYTSLLLTLCNETSEINISQYNNKLLIKSKVLNFNDTIKLIKALDGSYFYNLTSKELYIILPIEKTEKSSIEIKKDWEYILNPLSEVNIYSFNI